MAISRIGRRSVTRVNVDHRLVGAIVVASLLLFVQDAPSSPYQQPWAWGGRDETDQARLDAADLLGPTGSVTVSPQLGPLVADRVDLPIIAAGGICDARSAAAAVVLGAEGVQMGTRMLASHEAAVHHNFKDAIMAAGDDGTVMLDLPGNPTMRAGFSLITRATSRHPRSPGRTIDSTTTDSAVCSPSMPGRAFANSHIFSCSACGA